MNQLYSPISALVFFRELDHLLRRPGGRHPALPLPPALHHHPHRCPLSLRICKEKQFIHYHPDLLQHDEGDHDVLPALPPVLPPLGPGGVHGPLAGARGPPGSRTCNIICGASFSYQSLKGNLFLEI